MGKNNYLKYFQENLRDAIELLVTQEWGIDRYKIVSEYRSLPGKFNGIIDIAILDKESEVNVLAIEIEHVSSFDQALKNIEKLKYWAHNSENRRCSLLHVINESSSLSVSQLDTMVEFAKTCESKSLGFFYDFIFYRVDDWRTKKIYAYQFVNTMEFKTRLWLLLGLNNMR